MHAHNTQRSSARLAVGLLLAVACLCARASIVTGQAPQPCQSSWTCPVSLWPSTTVFVAVHVDSEEAFQNTEIDLANGKPDGANEVHVRFRNNMVLSGVDTNDSVTYYSPQGSALNVSDTSPREVAFVALDDWTAFATAPCLCHSNLVDGLPVVNVSDYAGVRVDLEVEFRVGRTVSCDVHFANISSPLTIDQSLSSVMSLQSNITRLEVASVDCGTSATATALRLSATSPRPCAIDGCVRCSQDGMRCEACLNAASLAPPPLGVPGAHAYASDAFSFLTADGMACVDACAAGHFLNETRGACVQNRACDDVEYEQAAPTATTDRVCARITTCKTDAGDEDEVEFEVASPTTTTDRVCQRRLPCNTGTVRDPTNPTICRQCDQGQVYSADDGQCVPLAANEYEVVDLSGSPPASEIRNCTCSGPCVRVISGGRDEVMCVPAGCPPGHIKPDYFSPDSECTNCGAGHEVPTTMGRLYGTCDAYRCPASTYDHDHDPSTLCRTCDAGSEIVLDVDSGLPACRPCSGNTTDHDYDASTPCLSCGTAVVARAGPCDRVACGPGTVLISGVCVPQGCPAGQELRDGRCQGCPSGHFSLGPRMPACMEHTPCSSGTYEHAAPSSSSDRICRQCSEGCTCTATGEACPPEVTAIIEAGSDASTGGSEAGAGSSGGSDFLPIGAGIGVAFIIVGALAGVLIARKRRGSNKPRDAVRVSHGHDFDRYNQNQSQDGMQETRLGAADTGEYEEVDTRTSLAPGENMYSAVRPDGVQPRPVHDPSSIYASIDQPQEQEPTDPSKHEGMDIYGSAVNDPSALYSVPVKKKETQHPDGLIYADLRFVPGTAEGGEVPASSTSAASSIRGERPPENNYAAVDSFKTLQAQQQGEGGEGVLDQKEVEYQNVDDFA